MNRIFNLIWSKTKERWIVVSEKVKGNGKVPTSPLRSIAALAAMFAAGPAYALDPVALPTGGVVTSGSATIATSGSQMTVDQTSQQMIANWQSFNIGQNAGVRFNQPAITSSALNRITDQNPTEIMGSLSANGQVFLLNPSGIIFGTTARVDVGGLVASSLNMLDSDYLAGKYSFSNQGSSGALLNQGAITIADGGVVALMAPRVSNEGSITVNSGSALLAAGNQVTLDFTGSGLISYTVNQGAIDALVENKGLVKADGGVVVMTAKAADALKTASVTNSGIVEARTIQNKGGRILLLSDMASGVTDVSGTLDASAPNGGDGGFVETSGGRVTIGDSAVVTTVAASGQSGTFLLDPYDFTIAATGGNITGAALGAALNSGSVTIQTASGGITTSGVSYTTTNSGINGDINVNDPVSWSANNTLTLSAYRNINVNANITASGAFGALALVTTWGYTLGSGAIISLSARTATPTTGNFSLNATYYTVITSLGAAGSITKADLQGINGDTVSYTNNTIQGNYVLGTDINASATSGWNAGAGFFPIASNYQSSFRGKFDGLGHTITGLTINRPTADPVGLFGNATNSIIRNISLSGPTVRGGNNVGVIVGVNYAQIIGCSVNGASVSGTSNNVGGLVGCNYGSISASSVIGGSVSGVVAVGGLVGYNTAVYFTGSASISNSYATGNVSGTSSIGGLVGRNSGSAGNYSSYGGTGTASISNSYATGKVSGISSIGGLVGSNSGYGSYGGTGTASISNSYATGNVSGTSSVGGLVGSNSGGYGRYGGTGTGSVSNSYAIGRVSGSSTVGGLVGANTGMVNISTNNWDNVLSQQSLGVGGIGASQTGVTGWNTADMMKMSSFASWSDISNTGGSSAVWRIYEGHTVPLLRSFLTPLTLADVSTTYNGISQSGAGTAALGVLGTAASGTTTGSYTSYSTQQGYDIIGGNLTINPATATVTGNSSSLTYNGSAQTVTGYSVSALQNGESASVLTGLSVSGATGTNAGSYANTVSGTAANGNYQLSFVNGSLSIGKATVTLGTAAKTYNGLTDTGNTSVTISGVNGETLGFSSATYQSKDVSANSTNYLTALSLSNNSSYLASNYQLPTLSHTTAAATINRALATVTGSSSSVTYTGLAQTVAGYSVSTLQNGESAAVVLSGLSAIGTGTNAGTYSNTVSGTAANGNYQLSFVNGSLSIGKATASRALRVKTPLWVVRATTP